MFAEKSSEKIGVVVDKNKVLNPSNHNLLLCQC